MTLNLPRYNGWLPRPAGYDAFFKDLIQRAASPYKTHTEHVPSVKIFQQAIHANPTMVELFNNIFLQSQTKIQDFEHLLYMLDLIVVGPPKFIVVDGLVNEPIGVPMYLVFDILSNNSSAYDLFRMKPFNEALQQLLRSWGEYLTTGDSSRTLTDTAGGWFSPVGIQALEATLSPLTFNQTYVVFNDAAPNRGYISWDEFFTRRIRPDARPFLRPLKGETLIYNACESTVERIAYGVEANDLFWLKGTMAYSLYDIFVGDNDTAQQFVGGTVYQAFLSPQDYHRWHSPISGKVVDARVVAGTYYAVLPDEGENGDMRGALIRSQPWLTVAATRAIITIQADSDKIGLVAFIGIGMAEVSSCQILVQPGHRVQPGDQLGMFHFGGSSHALIFSPQTKITFTDAVQEGNHLWVNSILAAVDQ